MPMNMTYLELYHQWRNKVERRLAELVPDSDASAMLDWYLRTTLLIESGGDNAAISKTGARGAFQILPSTEKRLAEAFKLPPLVVGDLPNGLVSGAIYALAHTYGDLGTYKVKGIPPLVNSVLAGWPLKAKVLASARFYYHNGTSHNVPSNRLAEVRNALIKFKSKMT